PEAYALITGEQASTALGVVLTYPGYATRSQPAPEIVPVTIASSVAPANGSPAGTLRVGLIGAGLVAQGTLLPALKSLSGVRLPAGGSAAGLSARHVAEKHQAAYCTTDSAQIIADHQVDAVLIATRHGSHAALAIKALAAGKPVFVEKPLA